MRLYLTLFLFTLFSCRQSDDSPQRTESDSLATILNAKPVKPIQDNRLIWTEVISLGELGPYNYDNLMAKKNKPTIKYLDELIYISTTIEVEACGTYFPNIKISNDTIKYTFVSGSSIACTSLAAYQVKYLIRNPKDKKYKIVDE